MEVNGIEIPEDPKRQAIEHVTNTTPPDNLENLMNGLHDLIVFQASFQAILDFVNQIPPGGGYVDDFYLFQTELGEARPKLELETPYFVSFPFFISFLERMK